MSNYLHGNALQLFINKELPGVLQAWPEKLRRLSTVHCEVVDHGRGIVTYANVRRSFSVATEDLVVKPTYPEPPGYQALDGYTEESVRAQMKLQVDYVRDMVELFIRDRGL